MSNTSRIVVGLGSDAYVREIVLELSGLGVQWLRYVLANGSLRVGLQPSGCRMAHETNWGYMTRETAQGIADALGVRLADHES
jgi:hypothetical protein